ncbi:MAG TPA: ABC transporter permease [Dehalococcoidia bacterium]|nr:ABC transporter permease [Dehalococcoidia bacterium]
MSLFDSIKVALEALIANKLRACLTMLGIIIGVGAVIALMAVGQGSQKAVQDKIAGLGSNLLFIEPGSTNTNGLALGVGTAQTLTQDDANVLPGTIPGVVAAVSEVRTPTQISASGTNTFARITGVSSDYANVLALNMEEGEFFSSLDVDQSKRVAVLGSTIAKTLFPGGDPVGQSIRLGLGRNNFMSLEVVGLIKGVGGNAQESRDGQIYVPITLAQRQIAAFRGVRGAQIVNKITVQLQNKDQAETAKKAIEDLLKQRHNVQQPDFVLNSQDDIAAAANEVNKTMTVLLGAIAGISLVVGGIGIMNIMLVSVTERTREIGIRKAVGARRVDIMMQFLTEALTVTALGGLIGIAVGLGTAQLLNGQTIAGLGENVQTVTSWTSVVAAFVVSAVIGIFFGLYPAQRAARLRPIEALRYE